MDLFLAAEVAVACVRRIGGFNGEMLSEHALGFLGIVQPVDKSGLRLAIVGDPNIGVRSKGYSIDPKHLNALSSEWTLGDLILVIGDNSTINHKLRNVRNINNIVRRVQG